MQITKEDSKAIVVTIVVHSVVLLALLFLMLSVAPAPDPPLNGGGMAIDFGMSEDGRGTDNTAMPTGPVVSPNPSDAKPVKSSSSASDVMTSETGEETVSIPKPEKKPTPEVVKPVEKPKPVINQGAILPGKKSTGGQGDGTMPGNKGRLDGTDGGKGTGGTTSGSTTGSTSGTGPNKGVGPSTKVLMEGRNPISLPKPRYTEQEDGTVVVKVTVDRTGKVVNATTDGVRGSTTTNASLKAEAVAAARQAKFDVKADAAPEQIGYIYYTFMRN